MGTAQQPRVKTRRTTRPQFAFALGAAAALGAVLIGASLLSARSESSTAGSPAQSSSSFAGIPQRGAALGSPTAPVTLVEYADIQCPYCAQWARTTLPVLLSDYVRTGKLRIVFRGLAFIGAESELALKTAVAAGRQDRLWDVVEGFYLSQGPENGGWVTESLVEQVATWAGLDSDRLAAGREQAWVLREIETASAAAEAAGVTGTPTFELGRTGGRLERVKLRSLEPEGLIPAIDELLGS